VGLRCFFKDKEGHCLGLVGISRDITDEKLAQERLAQQAQELARSNKELEQFGYVASHDLQEPLRMVASYTQLIARRTAATATTPPLPSPNGAATVLIVEDEATLRHLVQLVLERQGYTVLQAGTGVEAVGVWNQHQAAVDLLITDMVMPDGLSGRELAKQLLAEKPGLKVIYTSGYCLELGQDEFPHPDRHFFLQKPYPPHQLVRTVQACLLGTPAEHPSPLALSVA